MHITCYVFANEYKMKEVIVKEIGPDKKIDDGIKSELKNGKTCQKSEKATKTDWSMIVNCTNSLCKSQKILSKMKWSKLKGKVSEENYSLKKNGYIFEDRTIAFVFIFLRHLALSKKMLKTDLKLHILNLPLLSLLFCI
ncbi:hypothetical protein RFI_19842 [Reticulomyxa filosa]|uniref:Uncharacterized protein n=1 Tax=Reticulomyxa filosa TaxID=46433 RepID=X6MWL9_RETFI|nr:hypothetical protein RFI_19842 [Reticulomyxa filosa]|eukprot:ETO17480.1 hypothetical protein RFI_19842 [Reticulomyxa filosa]